jgi:hypothetical protein
VGNATADFHGHGLLGEVDQDGELCRASGARAPRGNDQNKHECGQAHDGNPSGEGDFENDLLQSMTIEADSHLDPNHFWLHWRERSSPDEP